ncbi:MAG: NAD(+) kinase [Bacteroidales bacterium]|nr:NAD(+) kinase [Bacteroidales bacterium]
MLKTVAIYSKEGNSKTTEGVNRLIRELLKRDIRIYQYQKSLADSVPIEEGKPGRFSDLGSLSELPDMVLSVGGDGTFLETMLRVMRFGVPIAGVNTGRMGFLANISDDEIGHSIDLLCQGDYEIIERSLLEIKSPPDLFGREASTALNEITVQKADPSMIIINIHVNEIYLNTYWADGLIISTATGSTAYNLSVGGPILSPEDESLIISPISPHNLTIRPIVISGESELKMTVEGRSSEYLVTCDFRSRRLSFDREINIIRSPKKLKTVMLRERDFYNTLRNKLMWGADKRN